MAQTSKVDMREAVMTAGKAAVQAHGYNALSFRDLAREVGIKSASVHYYFPTKGDLGAALARRYTEDGVAYLSELLETSKDPAWCMDRYTAIFRAALTNDNRMCLAGMLNAERDDLPDGVRIEVDRFTEANVGWIKTILALVKGRDEGIDLRAHAMAIFAAIEGAQLIARGAQDIAIFDRSVQMYRQTGLIP